MRRPVCVRIAISGTWREQVTALAAVSSRRPAGHRIDLSAVKGAIDVVIADRNVTSCVTQERPLPFLIDLCQGLRVLAQDRASDKILIECREEPWEVAIARSDRMAFVSVYSVDRHHLEVIAHDLAAPLTSWVEAAQRAGEEMVGALLQIDQGLASNPRVLALQEAIKGLHTQAIVASRAQAHRPDSLRHGEIMAKEGGCTMRYQFDPRYEGLTHFDAARWPRDLHALLVPGRWQIKAAGASIEIGPYPVLAAWEMAQCVQQAMGGAQERGRSMAHISIDYTTKGDLDQLVWSPVQGSGRLRHLMTRPAWVELLASATMRLLDDVAEVSPSVRKNARWSSIREMAEDALDVLRSARTSSHDEERAVGIAPEVAPEAPMTPALSFAWPMDRVLTMRASVAWHERVEEAMWRRATIVGDRLVIPTQQGMVALDVHSGQVAWRTSEALSPRAAPAPLRGGRHIAARLARDTGGFSVLDAGNGEIIGTPTERDEQGRPLRLHGEAAALVREDGGLMWLGERGEMVCVEGVEARAVWSIAGGDQGPAYQDWDDQVVALVQYNDVRLVDRASGRIWWRAAAGSWARAVRLHGESVVVIASGAHRSATFLRAFDRASGEPRGEVAIDGHYLGTSLSAADHLWVIVERQRRPMIEAFSGPELSPAWLRALAPQARALPLVMTPVMWQQQAHVIVRSAAAQTCMVRAHDGAMRWSVEGEAMEFGPLGAWWLPGGVVECGEQVRVRRLSDGECVTCTEPFVDPPRWCEAIGGVPSLIAIEMGSAACADAIVSRLDHAHFLAQVPDLE